MDQLLARYLDKALDFEEAGYIEEALALLEKLPEAFSEKEEQVRLEKAKLEFRNRMDWDALLDFITVYEKTGGEDLYNLILEAYFQENEIMLKDNYNNNIQYLGKYPHYRGKCGDEKPRLIPIWQDKKVLVYADMGSRYFQVFCRKTKKPIKRQEKVIMAVNELWMEDIQIIERNFCLSSQFLDMEMPIYLAFDEAYWGLFLQLYDLKGLLEKNRVVFLVGEQGVNEYFKESMVIFPSLVFCNDLHDRYQLALEQVKEKIETDNQENRKCMEEYYAASGDKIVERIQKGRPRILFYTSHFTTALQYHSRDCMQSAARLGCSVEMLKEPDGLHRIYERDIIQYLARFKPDIIFELDHFRFEYPMMPREIVCISWVQDPLPLVMSKETPLRLTDRDFIMSHYTTWRRFKEVGYPSGSLIDAPIPANNYIYKPYTLSIEESGKYSCDICFVCHACDVEGHIAGMLQKVPEGFKEAIHVLYKGYQDYVYESGELFYSEHEFREYIKGIVLSCYHFMLASEILNFISFDMYNNFNQLVFRQALADWILDAGFTNLKLWGHGWTAQEKYKGYAMGEAENGETLSKIYQASKIVIGNNVMTTSAARAWEAMLSGSFYLSNYIPEEEDAVDIRKLIEVGKDIVMFYNREDLIQKLHYYLENGEERKKMAECGRQAALGKMTYDALMKKVLEEVSVRLGGDLS